MFLIKKQNTNQTAN